MELVRYCTVPSTSFILFVFHPVPFRLYVFHIVNSCRLYLCAVPPSPSVPCLFHSSSSLSSCPYTLNQPLPVPLIAWSLFLLVVPNPRPPLHTHTPTHPTTPCSLDTPLRWINTCSSKLGNPAPASQIPLPKTRQMAPW